MTSRQLTLGLLLLVGFACKKGGASADNSTPDAATADQAPETAETAETTETAAKGPEVPGASSEFLVGKWTSDCINQPGQLQAAVYLQYEFLADGSATAKTLSYAGPDCTRRFTKPDVDAIKLQVNADRAAVNAAPLNAAEIASYDALWFPPISAFQFKLGRKLKDDTIEMNTTQKVASQDVLQYLVVYVQDGLLYFAETCSQAQVLNQACSKVVGDSEKNRARDMSNAIPFHKI